MVRNDYTALAVVFLFVMLCIGALGALVHDKALQAVTPSSAPIEEPRLVAFAPTAQPYQSPIPQPTSTPTPLSAMALAQPTFIAQTVTAGNAQATLDAARAYATATRIKLDLDKETADVAGQIQKDNDAQNSANRREMVTDVLLAIGVPLTLICLAFGVFKISQTRAIQAQARLREAEALAKDAEAKVAVEQRRLVEMQAVLAKEQARLAQATVAPISPGSIPGNGNGHEQGTPAGVKVRQN